MADGLDFDFDLGQGAPSGQAAGPSPETESESAPIFTRATRKRKRTGMYVKFDDSGSIKWDALDENEQQRLRDGLRETEPEELLSFSPIECVAIYAVLGEVETLLASWLTGIPHQVVRPIMSYSLPECGQLAQPTSRVLAKHGGEWLRKHKDEFVLMSMLLSLHQKKVLMLMQAWGEMKQREPIDVEPTTEQKVNGQEQHID